MQSSRSMVLAIAALNASCVGSSTPATVRTSTSGEASVDVHPLVTLTRDAPTDDLASIRKAIGDAEIVGLGETDHGNEAFQDAEGRLVASLVRDLGFRAVGFELGDDLVADAAACVDPTAVPREWGSFSGDGNGRTLEWICRWNRTHPNDRVHLFGTDIWLGPEDIRALTAWAHAALETPVAEQMESKLRQCFGSGATSGWRIQMGHERLTPVNAASSSACVGALDRLAKLAGEQHASPEVHLRIERLRGHQAFYSGHHDLRSRYEARDEAQVAITLRLRQTRFPDRRVVVIAHASHVAYRSSALENRPFISFGERLRDQLGDRYRAIAMSGFDVKVSRVQGDAHYRHEEPRSIERLVHDLGLPFAFVDFGAVGAPRLVRGGASYNVGFDSLVPRDHFAGLVVIGSAAGRTHR